MEKIKRAILYYTDNSLDNKLLGIVVKDNLRKISADLGVGIISVTQKPIVFGKNICVGEKPRNQISMMEQIVIGLQTLPSDCYVFLCEHDCLYHKSHFVFDKPRKPDTIYYNINLFRSTPEGYEGNRSSAHRLSMCSAMAGVLLKHFVEAIKIAKDKGIYWLRCVEPGRSRGIAEVPIETYKSDSPVIDIRHKGCLTHQPNMPIECYDVEEWGNNKTLRRGLGL